MRNKITNKNNLTKLLASISGGWVPVRYRKAVLDLLDEKGKSLLRAIYYDQLLRSKEKNSLRRAMKELDASRATILRDHKIYKHLFKEKTL